MPGRTKEVEWFGEAVIVDEASVHGEYAHEQDEVAPTEKGVPDLQGEKAAPVTKAQPSPHSLWEAGCPLYQMGWWPFPYADRVHQSPDTHLISAFLGQKALLINDHPECKAQHDSTMATVPKHHRKQEGEGNDSVGSCRRERSRSSAPSKQKGLIKEAVYPIRPFLTGTALKGLLNPSPTHQAVRSSAELALASQRMFNFMTCRFSIVWPVPSLQFYPLLLTSPHHKKHHV